MVFHQPAKLLPNPIDSPLHQRKQLLIQHQQLLRTCPISSTPPNTKINLTPDIIAATSGHHRKPPAGRTPKSARIKLAYYLLI